MTSSPRIEALFLDIGGVLLTGGWDRGARRRAAERFGFDLAEMDERHHLTFDAYETGKLDLDGYLERVVFYANRNFTIGAFKEFMFEQSKPYPETIDFMRRIKARHRLRVAAVSNEGRELTEYRIRKFALDSLIDAFVCSGLVHLRKPDADIFRLAFDVIQVPAERGVYIDDRPLFVEVASGLGLRGIVHSELATTQRALEELGLPL